SLLADLATVTRNIMAMAQSPQVTFVLYPKLTSPRGPRLSLSAPRHPSQVVASSQYFFRQDQSEEMAP
ncbi:MAG TPA: hypothetical protein VNZ53_31765, partial [Steroidobacteraceae bacterium]|nr:hypothetical protein [Steroidobacteraceae bacterium]